MSGRSQAEWHPVRPTELNPLQASRTCVHCVFDLEMPPPKSCRVWHGASI